MRRVTLDASVICKWYLLEHDDEADLSQASLLLAQVTTSRIKVIQPPHWLCEVASVLVRRQPARIERCLLELMNLPMEMRADPALYLEATRLSRVTGAHVFDTLYHAVALLEPNGLFITADARYVKAAAAEGSVMLLDSAPLEIKEPPRAYLVPRRERRVRNPRRAATLATAR